MISFAAVPAGASTVSSFIAELLVISTVALGCKYLRLPYTIALVAVGLVVGVFAFVCYHWLNARIDRLAHRMEDTQIEFLDSLNEPTK